MSANNGHLKPIPFPQASVPIVGQPFSIKGGYATAMLLCHCDAREPLLLIGNAPAVCPGCRRGYVIAAFTFTAQTGQIQVQIGQVVQREPGAPA